MRGALASCFNNLAKGSANAKATIFEIKVGGVAFSFVLKLYQDERIAYLPY